MTIHQKQQQTLRPASTIKNPYWERVRSLADKRGWMDSALESYVGGWREELCTEYSWALPDPATLDFLAGWLAPAAVEMGAGSGYIGWLLEQMGVAMTCYDNKPPDQVVTNHFHSPRYIERGKFGTFRREKRSVFHPITRAEPEVLAQHGDVSLLLCWPPDGNDMASRCLLSYPGPRLVYIGEVQYGHTGDDAFFELLARDWREVAHHRIAQWYNAADEVWVCHRRTETGGEKR